MPSRFADTPMVRLPDNVAMQQTLTDTKSRRP
jgi:hypothetical protein